MAQVILTNNTGANRTYTDSVQDLKSEGPYVTAEVKGGTWIFYKFKNYNGAVGQGSIDNVKILGRGQSMDITHLNGSMYLVPEVNNGVLFFEHFFYGGTRKLYQTDCSDLTDVFPPVNPDGVSSAIVLSHSNIYLAFEQKNYGGVPLRLLPFSQNPTFPGALNDVIQSVKSE